MKTETMDLKARCAALIDSNDSSVTVLDSLVYHSAEIREGTFIRVGSSVDGKKTLSFFQARVLKIYEIGDFENSGRSVYLMRVAFYFDKTHLMKKDKVHSGSISSRELFSSRLEDLLPISHFKEIVRMVSREEYEQGDIDDNVYFCEADYDIETGEISPPLDFRPRVCVCRNIENPDYHYIMCEKCEKWFHVFCVCPDEGANLEEKDFFCDQCT